MDLNSSEEKKLNTIDDLIKVIAELTDLERDILFRMLEFKSLSEISIEMNITYGTVRQTAHSLYKKFGVQKRRSGNRTELLRRVYEVVSKDESNKELQEKMPAISIKSKVAKKLCEWCKKICE